MTGRVSRFGPGNQWTIAFDALGTYHDALTESDEPLRHRILIAGLVLSTLPIIGCATLSVHSANLQQTELRVGNTDSQERSCSVSCYQFLPSNSCNIFVEPTANRCREVLDEGGALD